MLVNLYINQWRIPEELLILDVTTHSAAMESDTFLGHPLTSVDTTLFQ